MSESDSDERPVKSKKKESSKPKKKPSKKNSSSKSKSPKKSSTKTDTPKPQPVDDYVFRWGSYGSSCSTSFTGYDHPSMSLGSTSSDELAVRGWLTAAQAKAKPGDLSLSGRILGGTGLPLTGSSYVTVRLWGKRVFQSDVVSGGSAPDYDFEFDFGAVEKQSLVEIAVWAASDAGTDFQIGCVNVAVSGLELGSADKQVLKLTRPLSPSGALKDVSAFGQITAVFQYGSE
jgi:hypothetical protein